MRTQIKGNYGQYCFDIKALINLFIEPIKMSLSDFEILAQLGEGLYSNVYKVKRIQDGHIYALKKVQLIPMPAKEITNAINEVRILASIKHPNVIGYKEAFFDNASKSLCIVMEHADGGDLLQKIVNHHNKGQYLKEREIWDLFGQMTSGLSKLHELGILHRDVKSANFFLTRNGTVKIGDMNVSKIVRKEGMCETQAGAPFYSSPQVWREEAYDYKSDIWSLGCVLYELINLKLPFRARDMEGLFKKVSRGYYSRINKSYSEDLSDILKMLIQVNPKDRINLRTLMDTSVWKNNVKRRFDFYEQSSLIKTIKMTKNISYIGKSLPKPNYQPLKYRPLFMSQSSIQKKKSPKKQMDISASSQDFEKKKKLLKSKKKLSPTVKLSLPPLPSHSSIGNSSKIYDNPSGRYMQREISSEKNRPRYKKARSHVIY